jgi:predicted amidophosphoribosyltransferase
MSVSEWEYSENYCPNCSKPMRVADCSNCGGEGFHELEDGQRDDDHY